MKSGRWLFFCVLAVLLLGNNPVWAVQVTAKGMSFLETGREALAREKALDDAKRNAVEQAAGAAIESSTLVENFVLVKDRIMSQASGYLKNYRIIKETKSDLGTYEVTIEAEVLTKSVVGDVDRFQKMLSWQKNPRVSIVVDASVAAQVRPAAIKASNMLADRLKSGGFNVFRHDAQKAGAMGLLVGLVLESASVNSDYQGMQLTLNEISLSANVYRPGDDEILATAEAVRSLPGTNRLQVLDKGAKEAVAHLWQDLRTKLTRLWEKEVYGQRRIFLTVRNVSSHNQAKEIAAGLSEGVSGMISADLHRFHEGAGEYLLQYRGWPEHLVNELQMAYFQNAYFRTVADRVSANNIVLKLAR